MVEHVVEAAEDLEAAQPQLQTLDLRHCDHEGLRDNMQRSAGMRSSTSTCIIDRVDSSLHTPHGVEPWGSVRAGREDIRVERNHGPHWLIRAAEHWTGLRLLEDDGLAGRLVDVVLVLLGLGDEAVPAVVAAERAALEEVYGVDVHHLKAWDTRSLVCDHVPTTVRGPEY